MLPLWTDPKEADFRPQKMTWGIYRDRLRSPRVCVGSFFPKLNEPAAVGVAGEVAVLCQPEAQRKCRLRLPENEVGRSTTDLAVV